MDGVLIDAREWHFIALNKALAHFGYEISLESHLTTFDGLPTGVKLKMLNKTEGLPSGLHKLINELKQQYTLQLSYTHCTPKINHLMTLSKLKSEGLKIAVCSNSIRKTVETMMSLSGLENYLDLLLSNEDVVKPKPSPEIYLKAMSHFNLEPHECLILEDNENGIMAARESGAFVLEIDKPESVTYGLVQNEISLINKN